MDNLLHDVANRAGQSAATDVPHRNSLPETSGEPTQPSSNVIAEQKMLFCCRYDLHPAGATKTKAALEGVPLS